MMSDRSFEFVAAALRASVIERPDDVAVLRHHLRPEFARVPLIFHRLCAGAAIDFYEYRIFFRGVEIWRLDDAGVKRGSVGGFYRGELGFGQLIVIEFGYFIFYDGGHEISVGSIQALTGQHRSR